MVRGYKTSELYKMQQFYELVQKVGALHRILTWNHYLKLLPLKNLNEINYYISITIRDNLSYRKLTERIKSDEYGRLSTEAKQKLLNEESLTLIQSVPNPIVLIPNNNYEVYTEKIWQEIIFENIEGFMHQLGEGYAFIGREYKLNIGDKKNYIDYLFYNVSDNKYCVVEIKSREYRKTDYGQIKTYMNIVDKEIKKPTHNKTIGILITKEMNDFEVSLIDSDNVYKTTFKIKLSLIDN